MLTQRFGHFKAEERASRHGNPSPGGNMPARKQEYGQTQAGIWALRPVHIPA